MELFFAPLACSMASRISLYEAGATTKFTQVDTRSKRAGDGSDYATVNPMGMVPALKLDNGELLTENPAVLLYIADQHPDANLAPRDGLGRSRVLQWLSFVGTELHKVIFNPRLDPASNDGARQYALEKSKARLAYLDAYLKGRECLLDHFTVADAYLATVLNWAQFTGVDLKPYPAVAEYLARMLKRPSVARALQEEMELFAQARAKAQAAKK
jgi:glutathione S-transferase